MSETVASSKSKHSSGFHLQSTNSRLTVLLSADIYTLISSTEKNGLMSYFPLASPLVRYKLPIV